eukprot:14227625-Alexandrium_andersonii.AAC.1
MQLFFEACNHDYGSLMRLQARHSDMRCSGAQTSRAARRAAQKTRKEPFWLKAQHPSPTWP